MMNDEILELGKLIIKENEVNDYDMLNQWMINYIAEKMHDFENAKTETDKSDAGIRCRDAILTFWKSRHVNSSFNPFEDFAELYGAIRTLNKSNEATIFDDFLDNYNIDNTNLSNQIKKIRRCTNMLLKHILHSHVDKIIDEQLLEWIGVTKENEDNEDSLIIDDIMSVKVEKIYYEAIDKEIEELQEVSKIYSELAEALKNVK